MIQQIPLNGGLVTQVDGEEVSINACTELINAEFDKPGLIYKRKGSAAGVNTNKTFISIFRWVNPYFTNGITWIALDSSGEIWYSAGTTPDLTSWTTLTDLNIADARIYNHGSFLRVAGGTTVQPRIIQDIDRSFFYTDDTTSLFSYDNIHIGLPPKYPTTFEIDPDATKTLLNQGGGGKLPFATTAKSCFYKFTAVFDGNQELPFKDAYKAFALAAEADSDSNVQIRLKFDEDDWDPRITSINMYRAITDSEIPDDALYQKINVFETTQSTAENWINGTGESGEAVVSLGTAISGDVTTSHKVYYAAGSTTLAGATTLYNGGASVRSISEVHPNHLYLTADFHGTTDYFPGAFYWEIRDETNLAVNYDMASPYTDGWTFAYGGAQGYITEEASGKTGSNSIKMYGSGGSHWITSDNYIGVGKSGTTYNVKCWCQYTRLNSTYPSSSGMYLKVYNGSSYVTIDTLTPTQGTGWHELSGQYTTTSDTGFKVNMGTDSGSAGEYHWFDTVEVNEVLQGGQNVWTGKNVFALENSGVDIGAGVDKVAKVGGTDYIVLDNITDVFKVAGTPFTSNSAAISISSAGDQWSAAAGNVVYLDTYDTGSVPGVYHPLAGIKSTEVNYKYSVITDGRQFVAGVRLDPNAYTGSYEDHDNWVIFSELNQYDILPISNYIQLRDLQGGAITGLSSLMGDLVVFMERGIYRLAVPSVDPTSWSLSESEENIGCVVDTSIASWESGVFFAGKDHLYFLDANFKAHPMTASIKDDYQGLVNESARTFYDVKKNRLLCRFGSDGATIYSLDLSAFPEERWTKVTTGSGDMDIFTVDENLALYSYDESTQFIKLHDDSKSESTSFKRTTGWVSQANIDRSGVLRRLNLKYNSGDRIGVKIYIDGDDSTAIQWPDGNAYHLIPSDTSGADWYKCKPSVRCRSYRIELYSSDASGAYISSTNDTEIRRIEVEFE